jgi:hypothetical protein
MPQAQSPIAAMNRMLTPSQASLTKEKTELLPPNGFIERRLQRKDSSVPSPHIKRPSTIIPKKVVKLSMVFLHAAEFWYKIGGTCTT